MPAILVRLGARAANRAALDIGLMLARVTSRDLLEPGEELLVLRCGDWRCLVPAREVAQVHSAVMPTALPSSTNEARFAVLLSGTVTPVIFAAALFGAARASLRATDKIVVLERRTQRLALWVEAVEDLVEHEPRGDQADSVGHEGLFRQLSGAQAPLAVLEVGELMRLAAAPPREARSQLA